MSQVAPNSHADDSLEEHFFSQPPPAAVDDLHGLEHRPAALSAGQRRARRLTVAMIGASAVSLLVFAAFRDHFIVRPAELAATGAPAPLPQLPAATAASPSQAPATAPRPDAGSRLRQAQGALTPATTAATPAVATEESGPTASADEAAEDPVPPHAADTTDAPPETPAAASTASTKQATAPPQPTPTADRGAPRAHPGRARAKNPRFDKLMRAARRAFDRGDAAGAQSKALEAISLAPDRAYAYVLLAAARDALGNRAGAQAAYRRCVQQAKVQRGVCQSLARFGN